MATRFTPLQLVLIDEGRFLAAADADLQKAQQVLTDYAREHGDDAKKAKAKVVLEVTLQCEDPGNNAFSVRAVSKMQVPNRPPSVTLALEGEDEAGKHCLFVRRSGSTDDTPAQGVLATKDGHAVDVETGEVISKKPAAPAPAEAE
jgi:hypothetical protein